MAQTTTEQSLAGFVDLPERAAPRAGTPARPLRLGRLVKIGAAGGLLAVALGALLAGQNHITADNAVVSAYVLSVRSPIQGQVSSLRLHVGDPVEGSRLLARVVDECVSDERLVDLRAELARLQAEQAASLAERRRADGNADRACRPIGKPSRRPACL